LIKSIEVRYPIDRYPITVMAMQKALDEVKAPGGAEVRIRIPGPNENDKPELIFQWKEAIDERSK
jgi:hypothetical protein